MPSIPTKPSTAQSFVTTFVIFAIIITALFPSLFHYVWSFPLSLILSTLQLSTTSPSPSDPLTPPTAMTSTWFQKTINLPLKARGSYLITDTITTALPELATYKIGLLNLFVQHTSCALSLNESWDEDVRADLSDALDRIVPEDPKGGLYRHSAEGLDDMPAHIKTALIGASVTIPIRDGKLATGTWQGIWYLEFRASQRPRKLIATIQGEKA